MSQEMGNLLLEQKIKIDEVLNVLNENFNNELAGEINFSALLVQTLKID